MRENIALARQTEALLIDAYRVTECLYVRGPGDVAFDERKFVAFLTKRARGEQ